jgi:hypothetical protein
VKYDRLTRSISKMKELATNIMRMIMEKAIHLVIMFNTTHNSLSELNMRKVSLRILQANGVPIA